MGIGGSRELAVGELRARPGEKVRGFLTVTGPGYRVDIPVTIVNGAEPGPAVGITAGVHGAEYPGIEAAIRLARELDPQNVRGAVVVVPVVNMPAFHGRAVYINPLDHRNLNRTYPGQPAGSISEVMVHEVYRHVICPCDYFIDLHGGDMVEALVPFVIYFRSGRPEQDLMARRMANAYGIPRVVEGTTPGSGYAAAAAAGKPAILAEAGGQGVLDEDSVRLHLTGVRNVLGLLGVLDGGPAPEQVPLRPNLRMVWHRSEHLGIFYPVVGIGDRVKRGQLLGEIRDHFGDCLADVVSQGEGEILFLITCPPVSPGDPLLAVGEVQEETPAKE
jgi:predicted deacylase